MGMKRKFIIIIGILVIVVAAGAGIYVMQKGSTPPQTITAERVTLTKDIAFTGRLVPEQEVRMGFETPGTVSQVYVQEGDVVHAGDLLVQLDTRAQQLEAAAARADRTSAQEAARVAVQSAQIDAANIQAENARSLEQKRQAVRDAKKELDQIRLLTQQKVKESESGTSAEGAAYTNLRSAESAFHAAQQALSIAQKTAEKSNEAASSAVQAAQEKYVSTNQASSRVAGLASLEAREQLAYVSVSKGSMRAPFDGVVTSLTAEKGELALSTTPLVTIQTVSDLEVTADVLESDIANIEVGMDATVTFDALPSTESWEAHISYISPGAEIIEGVPTYKVKVLINNPDSRLRPGLTTNITVHAAKKDNVIAVPRRAIISKDDKEFVRIQTAPDKVEEREVKTGLVGSDGKVEVLSGLSGGEQVITKQEDIKP